MVFLIIGVTSIIAVAFIIYCNKKMMDLSIEMEILRIKKQELLTEIELRRK